MNPWAIIGMILFWVASLSAVGAWQRHDGKLQERTICQEQNIKDIAAANQKIAALTAEVRAKEQNHQAAMAKIATDREQERQNAKRETDDIIRNINAGSIVFFDAFAGERTDRGSASSVGAAPSIGDGGAEGRLSPELAGYIIREADRADDITKQLASCQEVIIADRITINGSYP